MRTRDRPPAHPRFMIGAQGGVVHWLTDPRTILGAALFAAVAGVIGETLDDNAWVQLVSVVCVVVGLVVVVLTVPGFGPHDRDDV